MRFSKIYRKKRKVLLPNLRYQQTQPPHHMSHWRPPLNNVPRQERQWFQTVLQSHALFCGCPDPVAHFNHMATRFGRAAADGQQQPPQPPQLRALPAPPVPDTPRRHTRSENPVWPGDGGGEGDRGEAEGDGGGADADDLNQEDIDELVDLLDAPE